MKRWSTAGECVAYEAGYIEGQADAIEWKKRKKGKWIDPAAIDVYRCSVCEEYTKLEVPRLFYHYCPNCGAEMEGGEDA